MDIIAGVVWLVVITVLVVCLVGPTSTDSAGTQRAKDVTKGGDDRIDDYRQDSSRYAKWHEPGGF
jgi:hypothetical protein